MQREGAEAPSFLDGVLTSAMVKRTETKAAAPPNTELLAHHNPFSHRSRKLDENTLLCFVFSVSGRKFWVQNSLKSKPKSVQREVWGGSGGGLGWSGAAWRGPGASRDGFGLVWLRF